MLAMSFSSIIVTVFLVSLTYSGLMIVKYPGKLKGTRQFIILQNSIRSFNANFDLMGSKLIA